jgi:hypothetical protein
MAALFKADKVNVAVEAVKPDKLRVGYQGWDDYKVVWSGQRLSLMCVIRIILVIPGVRR